MLVNQLVRIITQGPWTQNSVIERLLTNAKEKKVRRKTSVIQELAALIIQNFPESKLSPTRYVLMQFLLHDKKARRIPLHYISLISRGEISYPAPSMQPVTELISSWNLPTLRTENELADFLEVSPRELLKHADFWGMESKKNYPAAENYFYSWIKKKNLQYRLLEAPKSKLKNIQQRLLRNILECVPIHQAAHGFRTGRSTLTYATPHTNQAVVLHLDMQDFFPSINVGRIRTLFRWLGYPEDVARLLGGLCTNVIPRRIKNEIHMLETSDANKSRYRQLYQRFHLPQGAPTSPYLANLIAHRLDCRLSGLATTYGINYTRYADDLTFSGSQVFFHQLYKFRTMVNAIILDEGFSIRHRKTRVLTQAHRQQVTGIVINQKLNLPREDYDLLKATLFNLVRDGLGNRTTSDREELRLQLMGKISYLRMLNPERAEKLTLLFQKIIWSE